MKVSTLKEIRERIAKGYRGELLYNLNTGYYEITTWKNDLEDLKTFKIPRGQYAPSELKDAVYGPKYN